MQKFNQLLSFFSQVKKKKRVERISFITSLLSLLNKKRRDKPLGSISTRPGPATVRRRSKRRSRVALRIRNNRWEKGGNGKCQREKTSSFINIIIIIFFVFSTLPHARQPSKTSRLPKRERNKKWSPVVCVDESKKFHSGGTTARIDSPENKKTMKLKFTLNIQPNRRQNDWILYVHAITE